jgi:hypothetical protein
VLRLLLAGGLVATVLPKVTLLAPRIDLGSDGGARVDKRLQLPGEPVMRFLSEPGGDFGHGDTQSCRCLVRRAATPQLEDGLVAVAAFYESDSLSRQGVTPVREAAKVTPLTRRIPLSL